MASDPSWPSKFSDLQAAVEIIHYHEMRTGQTIKSTDLCWGESRDGRFFVRPTEWTMELFDYLQNCHGRDRVDDMIKRVLKTLFPREIFPFENS